MNKVYGPWGLEELDTTEQLTLSTSRLLAREVGDGLSMGVPMSPVSLQLVTVCLSEPCSLLSGLFFEDRLWWS